MNNLLLLSIISLACLLIITPIILYQFIQQQQALNKIEKMLNPKSNTNPESSLGYDTYQECYDYWKKYTLTDKQSIPIIMCEEYK